MFFIASFIYFTFPDLAVTVPVVSVVDGDTIVVHNAGKISRFVLYRINAVYNIMECFLTEARMSFPHLG